MALRSAAGDKTGKVFDGVLAMDPNLEKGTCVLTGLFARVDPRNPDDVVDLLRKAAEGCETVDEWAEIHDHVANAVDKLNTELSTLVRQCQDISGPFFAIQPDEQTPFIQWFRKARGNASMVRCRFADDPQKRAIIADVRMQHLDNGCLGEGFTNDSFAFIPETRHLDLMRTEVFRKHMDDFLVDLSD